MGTREKDDDEILMTYTFRHTNVNANAYAQCTHTCDTRPIRTIAYEIKENGQQ